MAQVLKWLPAEVLMVISVELRGVQRRRVFGSAGDRLRFMEAVHRLAERRGVCVVAFCLMTNHVHLVVKGHDQHQVVRFVEALRQGHARRALPAGLARFDRPHMEVLSDGNAVLRYVAYAHANPVQARMVDDPVAWPFSSHRDVLGLRLAPWFSGRMLSRVTELDPRSLKAALHSRSKGQLPLPSAMSTGPAPGAPRWSAPAIDRAAQGQSPDCTLADIERAVVAVYGRSPGAFRARNGLMLRDCFVASARAHGWPPAAVARYLGFTRRHTRRLRARTDTGSFPLEAVRAHVVDGRLRPPPGGWLEVPLVARGPGLWGDGLARTG